MINISKQTAQIKRTTTNFQKKYQELGTVMGRYQDEIKEVSLRQEQLKEKLIHHCNKLLETAKSLPPILSSKIKAGLEYLKSELIVRSIDNIEGIHRLVRISRDLGADLVDIEIVQGSSPISQITGTSYRLRIGGIFEAVVKGETAAIWDFPKRKWIMLNDPMKARLIMNAVEVRTGKKEPSLVQIPIITEVKK